MGRGARHEPVFLGEAFYQLFLSILSELPGRHGMVVHGYCLMPNHYHLMLESTRGNLSSAMAFLVSRFTVEANRLHAWDGPVFRGRFHNRLVRLDQHWTHLLGYLHLNPLRARLVVRPDQWRWSSHHAYAKEGALPEFLRTAELLEMLEPLGGYEAYLKDMRTKKGEVPDDFEAVMFHGKPRMSDDTVKPAKHPRMRPVAPGSVLRRVAGAAGVSVKDLSLARFGRAGHPARAVAVHLLVCEAGLAHKEVAALLRMTESNVSAALSTVRTKRYSDHPIAQLLEALGDGKSHV
jgi:REP element-mobilizing transposase RayT